MGSNEVTIIYLCSENKKRTSSGVRPPAPAAGQLVPRRRGVRVSWLAGLALAGSAAPGCCLPMDLGCLETQLYELVVDARGRTIFTVLTQSSTTIVVDSFIKRTYVSTPVQKPARGLSRVAVAKSCFGIIIARTP